MRWLLVLAVMASCQSGKEAECRATASKVVGVLSTKDNTAVAPDVVNALTARCTSEDWTAEARACLAKATSSEAQRGCYKQLTAAQVEHVRRTLAPLETWVAEALEATAKFRDKMCACKSDQCTKAVSDEMTAWSKRFPNSPEPNLSEADEKKSEQLMLAMLRCMSPR